MPESVRMRDEPAERRGVEPLPGRGEEERVVRAAGEGGAGIAEVAGDPDAGLLAEGHDTILGALAVADVHELLLEVDVAEVEPDCLCAPEAGRVDELDKRAVSHRERRLAFEAGQLRIDVPRE